jgi:hypothetical protein
MHDPFPEELLSAYLDGELPHDERARVEQWLAASADHRRLFDDLQAIRRELQALPQQSLDAGFSDRVLTAIRERSGDSSASPPAASGASPIEPTPSAPIKPASLQPRHLGMPAWRWFAAGVAATLAAVLVGINAAPRTMAQIGKLAQLSVPESSVKGKSPGAAGSGLEPRPAPQAKSRSTFSSANKDAREEPTEKAESPQAAAPPEQVELHADAAPPAAPNAAISAPLSAGGSRARQFDKKNAPAADSRENMPALDNASPPSAAAFAELPADAYDKVVELPVTVEQADRALALYSQATDRQAARRFRTTSTLATVNAKDQLADRFAAQDERQALVQHTASGMSLLKLVDAATQGIEVAALEVTGPEAEVQSLLDSLGVAEARDLRPERSLARDAGGMAGLQAAREGKAGEGKAGEGEVAAPPGAALPARPEAKSSATAPAEGGANAGGNSGKPEQARAETRSAGANAARKLSSSSVRMGGFREAGRDRPERMGEQQLESLDASPPQLRVRLVIVPSQADPVDPAIEAQPSE